MHNEKLIIIFAPSKVIYNDRYPMVMFHCVWGWNGMNNGYFSYDNLTLGGKPNWIDPNKDFDIPNAEYNFTYNLEYIGLVKPQ